MDVSLYEGTVEVPVGSGGVVVMRTMIPGAEREKADQLRIKVRTSAKAKTTGDKVAAEDMEVQTEMDEAAYNLALLGAFVVGWNLTRHGMPIPVTLDELGKLPDVIYSALVEKAKELLGAKRDNDEQTSFRDGGSYGRPHGIN